MTSKGRRRDNRGDHGHAQASRRWVTWRDVAMGQGELMSGELVRSKLGLEIGGDEQDVKLTKLSPQFTFPDSYTSKS